MRHGDTARMLTRDGPGRTSLFTAHAGCLTPCSTSYSRITWSNPRCQDVECKLVRSGCMPSIQEKVRSVDEAAQLSLI